MQCGRPKCTRRALYQFTVVATGETRVACGPCKIRLVDLGLAHEPIIRLRPPYDERRRHRRMRPRVSRDWIVV